METSTSRPCIVVGYDGSEPSKAAVIHAAERAGRAGRMFIVHAVGPVANWVGATGEQRVDEHNNAHGRALLDELMLEVGNVLMDRDFEVELVPGSAAQALCHVAEVRDADEIVLGSRGQGRVGSLLGSVSEDVLRHADRPVVVIPYAAVRERAGSPIVSGPALLCYDGSEESGNAIARAGELLGGGQAMVVHVWAGLAELLLHSDLQGMTGPIVEAAEDINSSDRDRAEKLAAEGAQLAIGAGFQAQPLIIRQDGSTWQTLRACALTHNASIVVVGARGRSRIASALLGSVSNGLVHHAPAPVMVVPGAANSPSDGPILFANDGSVHAEHALRTATALLAPRRGVVAHAWQSFEARTPSYVPVVSGAALGMARELDQMASEEAEKLAHESAARAGEAGFESEVCCLQTERPIWWGILEMAADEDAAAIVVGSRGLSGISAALGSVAYGVVHHSRRPVLLVPPADD